LVAVADLGCDRLVRLAQQGPTLGGRPGLRALGQRLANSSSTAATIWSMPRDPSTVKVAAPCSLASWTMISPRAP
jgi:hypothetical protein